MKQILIFLLLSIGTVCSAQKESDSLWSIWKDTSKEDTLRLKSLVGLNNSFVYKNPDSAIVLAKKGVRLADEARVFKYKAKFLNQLGRAETVKSNYKEALSYFDQSLTLSKKTADTFGQAKVYINMGNVYIHKGGFDTALDYYAKSLAIYEKIKYKQGVGAVNNNMGLIAGNNGDYDLAEVYFNKSLEISLLLKDSLGISRAYGNLANLSRTRGEIEEAIQFFSKSLTIKEKIDDINGIAITTVNLGNVYKLQGNFTKAIDLYSKSLIFYKKMGNQRGVAGVNENIGGVYEAMNEYEKALEFYKKSLAIRIEIDAKKGVAESYINLGSIYETKNENLQALTFFYKSFLLMKEVGYQEGIAEGYYNLGRIFIKSQNKEGNVSNVAFENVIEQGEILDLLNLRKGNDETIFYKKSLAIFEEIENKSGIAKLKLALANYYKIKGNNKKSLPYALDSYNIASETGNIDLKKTASKLLAQIYEEKKDFKNALIMKETYISLRDSLENESNQKAIIQHEYRSQYEKQAIADSIKHLEAQKINEIEIAKQKTEIKNKKLQQYALFGGLSLMVLFLIFILKKNKEINLQKEEINIQKEFAEEQQHVAEAQKEELTHQHNQIRDSIDYAQTLQKSVLPSFTDVNNNFPNNFVYFQPKDVVSGDFFWTYSKGNLKYLAVVDCTGHGVPGAFMTIVANNLLNEIMQDNFNSPKEIIEELHRRIKIRVGGHKDAKVRDSMDLGLLSYNQAKKEVLFVGTHTSLYLVRNGKLQKFKGSKADIGYSEEIQVEQHNIAVIENDMLYFHSDGYPDQKGGAKNKKFYYKPIRNKFEEISLLNLEEQKSIMQKTFNDWKGNKEQLDDVCMIGVRV